VYAVLVSLAEQVILLLIMVWMLPWLGLDVPSWAVALFMVVLGVYSVVLTRLNYRALNQVPILSPGIGARGKVVQAVAPRGYVRIGNELWSAQASGRHLDVGEEVVVVRMEGLTVFVASVDG